MLYPSLGQSKAGALGEGVGDVVHDAVTVTVVVTVGHVDGVGPQEEYEDGSGFQGVGVGRGKRGIEIDMGRLSVSLSTGLACTRPVRDDNAPVRHRKRFNEDIVLVY